MSTVANRCHVCGDPCGGWTYCRKCHAYNDLYAALQHGDAGIDEYRLRRALAYINPRRKRALATTDAVVALTLRVKQLEAALF
jgi:hypothetical protein